MGWNAKDAWPEPNKLMVKRRVKELQQQTKITEQLAEIRNKKIERLRCLLTKLEQEDA